MIWYQNSIKVTAPQELDYWTAFAHAAKKDCDPGDQIGYATVPELPPEVEPTEAAVATADFLINCFVGGEETPLVPAEYTQGMQDLAILVMTHTNGAPHALARSFAQELTPDMLIAA